MGLSHAADSGRWTGGRAGKAHLEMLSAAIAPEAEASGVGQLAPAPRVAADGPVPQGLPGRDA